MQQLKEKGKQVIVLDSRLSNTGATQASEYISVVPGTDAALAQAIMYELIVNTWDAAGNKTGSYPMATRPVVILMINLY